MHALLHLSWSLEKISCLCALGHFLIINHDFVSLVTELAVPELGLHLDSELTVLVEHALAPLTVEGVSSCHLCLILQALQGYLGDVRIELLPELSDLLLLRLVRSLNSSLLLEGTSHHLTALTIVTQVEISLKVILVHRAARIVALDVLIVTHLLFAEALAFLGQ